jgi:hypothetical protein
MASDEILDRTDVLEMSVELCHRSEMLRRQAVIMCESAALLRERLAGRIRSSALLRPLALRGGVEMPTRDQDARPTQLVCRICHEPIGMNQPAVSLRTAPAHLDCAYPPASARSLSHSPIESRTTIVPLKSGDQVVAWDHRCGICGSTWRAIFMSSRCPVCAGRR